MSAPSWSDLETLFHEALAFAPVDRAAFLAERCAGRPALHADVEALLRAHESAPSAFDVPPVIPQLRSGARLGPYEVLASLGAGGMGEVYRARDTHLGRDIALKILPTIFTTDPERRARFEREAQILAALNHPHIGAIYGFEQSGDVRALVLELVEGLTLADRLKKAPIPVAEALGIASQIAEGLEAAHETGIVHRDLKPANIKITPDGTAKVLDFGLAKGRPGSGSGPDGPLVLMTTTEWRPGAILGTPVYMSPEQARGLTSDKRTDIWAFGCVLYEMLTGERAFGGADVSSVMASVLAREPNLALLPADTPLSIRRLLRRCLRKEPHERLRDIGDARIEIQEARAKADPDAMLVPAPVDGGRGRARVAWTVAGLLALTSMAAVAGSVALALRPPPAAPEVRVEISTPPTTDQASLALSPDGQKLVFVADSNGRPHLWLRSLAAVSARPLAATEGAAYPFWSPDSRSVAFFAEGKLKRIDIQGGTAHTLTTANIGRGGTWNREGVILFAPTPIGPLFRVSDTGGEPVAVTRLGTPRPVGVGHRFPQFLPDGRHFVFAAVGPPPHRGLYVASLDGSVMRRLLDAETAAVVASGHVLFVRQGTLFAQRFDPVRLELAGSPFLVAEDVAFSGSANIAALSSSPAGPLAYRAGAAGDQRQFIWFDRSGRELGTVGDPDWAAPANPQLSPDGRRVALNRTMDGRPGIWLLETSGGVLSRFTFDGAPDAYAVWSPDGRRVVFSSNRGGLDLYEKPGSGGGTEELLLHTPVAKVPTDWSSDGRFLLFRTDAPNSSLDLWVLPMGGDRTPFPVMRTNFDERDGQFSPDGRWIAYESNESGRSEIYVQRFPEPRGKWQLSTDGGAQVRWRPDGDELFYIALDGRLMAVAFQPGSDGQAVEPSTPVSLFATRIPGGALQGGFKQQYVISPDGRRFLINSLVPVTSPITLILNWKPGL